MVLANAIALLADKPPSIFVVCCGGFALLAMAAVLAGLLGMGQ